MIPGRIEGATHALGAPQGWNEETSGPCGTLAVRAEQMGDQITFTSAWEPTPDELKLLNSGAMVNLRVVGGQPPCWVFVGADDEAAVSASAARLALLTEAARLFREYERHHRAEADKTRKSIVLYDDVVTANRDAKAERNADIASRIEALLQSTGEA